MLDSIGESAIELAILVVLSLLSVALFAAGVVIETIATSQLLAGDPVVGLWEAAFGLILVYAGAWAIGRHEVLPRLQARRD